LAGFGAGAMLAAVSFDLVAEAEELTSAGFGLWALLGVAVFLVGDWLVERRFGDEGVGGALGIVVGSVVDGVPESVIFGIQLATGLPLSVGFIAAVLVSNVPQAIAPSAELAASGWSAARLARLWLLVVLACAVAAAVGFGIADATSAANGERMAALAAGGLLAMLTNSLIPFAYERAGQLAGVATVVGFCAALTST
jgi:ZIP family zinc transporter